MTIGDPLPPSCPIIDFKFHCPHCSQHLEGPVELAESEVNCPACGKAFHVPAPPIPPQMERITTTQGDNGAGTTSRKRYWVVDVRIRVLCAPPIYIQMLVEAPNTWSLSTDGILPEVAFEAVRKAASARYPHTPVTPIKIRTADTGTLERISADADYVNESCKVWLLGKPISRLHA